MNEVKKFDRRRKYYMIFDCETATLPLVNNYPKAVRKTISIAMPLIYDMGYTIVDRKGHIYAKRNFLISEIFSVPAIFDTAYYKDKRQIYLDLLSKNEIELTTWKTATRLFEYDLSLVESVGAYNAMFDYKKAIAFTEQYINALYSPHYSAWEQIQNKRMEQIAKGSKPKNKNFDKDNFTFRGKNFPLFDLWGLSCIYLLNNNEYRQFCYDNNLFSASEKYFSTTAENTFRFITDNSNFEEAHTALNDAEIESEIFGLITKKSKNKYEMGIIYFPFRILGKVQHTVP